ncbi:hypothetical protein SDC9_161397 [bioreactor metagenome]|uniref:Fumarate reductase/succinate dehydrogenase flavoprotein-like C-terminal domain-containing protein n=1 Tax=bioreactor metagenome TaxID=1076179 RepID=A0A645FI48_9ZZZZ
MTKKGGIVRNISELTEAAEEIGQYEKMLSGMSLNTIFEIETLNMATVALEILKGATSRNKSAGAHYRSDDRQQ